jgi:zinc protease
MVTKRVIMKRILFSLLLLLGASCSSLAPDKEVLDPAAAGDLGSISLNIEVERMVLPNGLRVLLVRNPVLPIYSYYTFYDVGGRYEGPGTTGATHFLEHMMFKGSSETYGPGFFDNFINNNGGSTNAYTTFDSTVYYQNMPTPTLDEMIKVEADRMQNILLIPYAFESERRVILEERKMRYENSPRGQLFQAMTQELFAGTPYGGSVIGSEEDVLGLDRDRMLEFHQTFYAPNNAIIVIVGDININQTRNWIRRSFGSIPKNPALEGLKREYNKPENYALTSRLNREVRLKGQSPRPIFLMAYPGVALNDPRGYALDFLSTILGSGESSYLNQVFVRGDRPQLSNIGTSSYSMRYNGVFFVAGELLERTNLAQFRRNLINEGKTMCEKAIDERALQKTRNQYMVGYYRDLQTNSGIASFLGMQELFFGNYENYKVALAAYQAVTLEDVQTMCRDLFTTDNHLFLSVWDKHP